MFLKLFKSTTAAATHTHLSTDPLKANLLKSTSARNRLGAVPLNPPAPTQSGPTVFPARYKGKKGTFIIQTDGAGGGWVGFRRDGKDIGDEEWTVAIRDVDEVRKRGGLGWKGRFVVGWSMEKGVLGGIEIAETGVLRQGETVKTSGEVEEGEVGVDGERRWLLTAVGRRDEAFNRLIAVGGQKWVAW